MSQKRMIQNKKSVKTRLKRETGENEEIQEEIPQITPGLEDDNLNLKPDTEINTDSLNKAQIGISDNLLNENNVEAHDNIIKIEENHKEQQEEDDKKHLLGIEIRNQNKDANNNCEKELPPPNENVCTPKSPCYFHCIFPWILLIITISLGIYAIIKGRK